ncbi:MAG: MTH1187 family thiamine-binding protein [Endomicrobiales bacterium]|nr:MTH1187 family thiamine-binding protein [Endomicrobiales bacterium]
MAIVEISIVPVGTNTASVSKFVARALEILKKEHKLKYQLKPMGTIIEGDLNHVLNVCKKMHGRAFSKRVKRVVTTIKIDERTDKKLTMKGKIKSVRKRIGKTGSKQYGK